MTHITEKTSSVLGSLRLLLVDENGVTKLDRVEDNLVTTIGKTFIASRLISDTAILKLSHMAVGSGSTAAAIGDTELDTELGRAVLVSQTSLDNVASVSATFGPGVGTGAIVETGIFNAASAGIMFNRSVFTGVNKSPTDTLTISWAITVS